MVTKQNETVEFSKMWFIISKVQMTSLIIFELKHCIFERKSKITNENGKFCHKSFDLKWVKISTFFENDPFLSETMHFWTKMTKKWISSGSDILRGPNSGLEHLKKVLFNRNLRLEPVFSIKNFNSI